MAKSKTKQPVVIIDARGLSKKDAKRLRKTLKTFFKKKVGPIQLVPIETMSSGVFIQICQWTFETKPRWVVDKWVMQLFAHMQKKGWSDVHIATTKLGATALDRTWDRLV